MRTTTPRLRSAGVGLLLATALSLPLAAQHGFPRAQPEEVGLSSARLSRITAMIQQHVAAGDIPGGVTLVARRGRIVHLEAHGVMDLESQRPMTTDAAFRLASMTKPVTGVAAMMMLEEGKLSLSDPVSKFIPEFADLQVAVPVGPSGGRGGPAATPAFYRVPARREITIRDLHTHTSGLASGSMSNRTVRDVVRQQGETLADYIPRLGRTALEFQPGTRWAYSAQAGHDTLGRIVEIVSGQSFDQFLQDRLFEPLGMHPISFYPTEELTPRMPMVYRVTRDGLTLNQNPNSMSSRVYFMGSGGLITTAEEYLKFGQMLLNGGQLNDRRILSPRTVDLMTSVHIPDSLPGRPAGEGYGLSVRVVTDHIAGGQRISDGSFGWSGVYGTHFWVDPQEEIVALLLTQASVREMRAEFENLVMAAIVE